MGTTIYLDGHAGGRIQRRIDSVSLRDEAHAAYRLWLNMWGQRLDTQAGKPVRNRLDPALLAQHCDTCARLAEFVIADIAGVELPDRLSGAVLRLQTEAEFAAAQRIRAEHDRLDAPAPPVVLAYDDSDECSHGISFDDDCADCAA